MSAPDSPIGSSVAEHIAASLADPEVRAEYERVASYEALARIVIVHRRALGLTQVELARLMQTTASAVSRIESGRHATSPRTLTKLATAFGARAVFGLEFGSEAEPRRELVIL